MRILGAIEGGRETVVRLTALESRALRSALVEACLAMRASNLRATVGCSEGHAQVLLGKLDRLDLERENDLSIGLGDVEVLRRAHAYVLRELGAEEYATRTGVEFAKGEELLVELNALASQTRPAR